jgi:hypothetical protein
MVAPLRIEILSNRGVQSSHALLKPLLFREWSHWIYSIPFLLDVKRNLLDFRQSIPHRKLTFHTLSGADSGLALTRSIEAARAAGTTGTDGQEASEIGRNVAPDTVAVLAAIVLASRLAHVSSVSQKDRDSK